MNRCTQTARSCICRRHVIFGKNLPQKKPYAAPSSTRRPLDSTTFIATANAWVMRFSSPDGRIIYNALIIARMM